MWLECWTDLDLCTFISKCALFHYSVKTKCQFTFYEAILIKSRRSKLCVS